MWGGGGEVCGGRGRGGLGGGGWKLQHMTQTFPNVSGCDWKS